MGRAEYVLFLPPGVSSIKYSRTPLMTDELREEYKNVEKRLDSSIEKDIRENRDIKYEERKKAIKEMKRK